MWNFINTQPGLATAVLDFTNDLSLLLLGLVGVIWLSVGAIVFMAVQHYLLQATKPAAGIAPAPADYQDAA